MKLKEILNKINKFDFNSELFENNQNLLLKIANNKLLRWLLCLNKLPKDLKKWKIVKITPASIHKQNPDGSFTSAHFTRPRFAEALAFNLSPFAYLKNARQTKFQWRLSPVGLASSIILALSGVPIFIGTVDRKSTRLNSSHTDISRMPSSA